MTPQQAKEFLPLLAAYAQGKRIQYTYDGKIWEDTCNISFTSPISWYRVKPDPIILKYRRYILTDHKGFYVSSISQNLNEYADVNKIEKMSCFVRWIDNDWVTYECEI